MYVFWAFKITRIGHSKKRPQTREIAPYVGVHPDEERCDGQYLATAANAVDHAVERRVLLVDRIVWIHQAFLRGHLIGARLSVADVSGYELDQCRPPPPGRENALTRSSAFIFLPSASRSLSRSTFSG